MSDPAGDNRELVELLKRSAPPREMSRQAFGLLRRIEEGAHRWVDERHGLTPLRHKPVWVSERSTGRTQATTRVTGRAPLYEQPRPSEEAS